MKEIIVSWTEYHQYIEALALQIHQSEWKFNSIVCLARGGLRVGDVLSRIFNQPLAILAVASYQENQRGELTIATSITMTTKTLPDRVLLVDDLVDSGETMIHTINWLKEHHGIKSIKSAVIWYKAESKFQPDYYVKFIADNAWIKQPFEFYESWKFD